MSETDPELRFNQWRRSLATFNTAGGRGDAAGHPQEERQSMNAIRQAPQSAYLDGPMTLTTNNKTARDSVTWLRARDFAANETPPPIQQLSPGSPEPHQGRVAWILRVASPLGAPNDRQDIDGLPKLVWGAVNNFNPAVLVPVAPVAAGIAFEAGTLLTLLTYCYSSGTYGSQDIEYLMCEDRVFRALCRDEFPRWRVLRRFRRYNRLVIEPCLAAVLRELPWNIGPGESGEAILGAALNRFDTEADRRIETATVIDLMAEED